MDITKIWLPVSECARLENAKEEIIRKRIKERRYVSKISKGKCLVQLSSLSFNAFVVYENEHAVEVVIESQFDAIEVAEAELERIGGKQALLDFKIALDKKRARKNHYIYHSKDSMKIWLPVARCAELLDVNEETVQERIKDCQYISKTRYGVKLVKLSCLNCVAVRRYEESLAKTKELKNVGTKNKKHVRQKIKGLLD